MGKVDASKAAKERNREQMKQAARERAREAYPGLRFATDEQLDTLLSQSSAYVMCGCDHERSSIKSPEDLIQRSIHVSRHAAFALASWIAEVTTDHPGLLDRERDPFTHLVIVQLMQSVGIAEAYDPNFGRDYDAGHTLPDAEPTTYGHSTALADDVTEATPVDETGLQA